MEGVEDERLVGDGGVVVGERVGEMLLTMAVVGDRGAALVKLAKLIVEVDRLVGLVSEEEIASGEPELSSYLITGKDHVSDILIDGGMEDVEGGVVRGGP
jgi:hypothetical protein